MVETQDLDVLKDIPGYKAILKALIKSQIQHLVEQLSSHTEEECLLLSASLSDGSLSHLGSDFGKQFLDSHVDVKNQFLGFCLKKQHNVPEPSPETQQQIGNTATGYAQNDKEFRMGFKQRKNRIGPISGRPRSLGASPYGDFRPNKQSPVRNKFSTPTSTLSHSPTTTPNIQPVPISLSSAITDNLGENYDQIVKQEVQTEFGYSGVSTQDQSGSQTQQFGNNDSHSENQTGFSVSNNGENTGTPTETIVKLEPVNEDESDLEITGIELSTLVDTNWGLENQSDVGDQTSENLFFTKLLHQGRMNVAGDTTLSDSFQSPTTPPEPIEYNDTVIQKLQDGTFKCVICQRIFKRRDYVKKHLLIHFGVHPYKCVYCSGLFRQRSQYRLHMFTKHGVEMENIGSPTNISNVSDTPSADNS